MHTLVALIAAQRDPSRVADLQRLIDDAWSSGHNYRVRYTTTEFLIPLQREKFFVDANELADWYNYQCRIARENVETFRIDQMWVWLGREVEVDDFTPFIKRLN